VNGAWLESAVIPDDLPMTGGFIDLRLESERQVG
jgi:predicted metalloendopeptidase